jgi:hypothetical protein
MEFNQGEIDLLYHLTYVVYSGINNDLRSHLCDVDKLILADLIDKFRANEGSYNGYE